MAEVPPEDEVRLDGERREAEARLARLVVVPEAVLEEDLVEEASLVDEEAVASGELLEDEADSRRHALDIPLAARFWRLGEYPQKHGYDKAGEDGPGRGRIFALIRRISLRLLWYNNAFLETCPKVLLGNFLFLARDVDFWQQIWAAQIIHCMMTT